MGVSWRSFPDLRRHLVTNEFIRRLCHVQLDHPIQSIRRDDDETEKAST